MKSFTDGCADVGAAAAGAEFLLRLSAGATFYALIEARAAYAPNAGEQFTLTIDPIDFEIHFVSPTAYPQDGQC